jgi:hypothetical protein
MSKDMLPKEEGQGQDGDKKAKPVPRTCYLKRTARAWKLTSRPKNLDTRTCYLKTTARARMVKRRPTNLDTRRCYLQRTAKARRVTRRPRI